MMPKRISRISKVQNISLDSGERFLLLAETGLVMLLVSLFGPTVNCNQLIWISPLSLLYPLVGCESLRPFPPEFTQLWNASLRGRVNCHAENKQLSYKCMRFFLCLRKLASFTNIIYFEKNGVIALCYVVSDVSERWHLAFRCPFVPTLVRVGLLTELISTPPVDVKFARTPRSVRSPIAPSFSLCVRALLENTSPRCRDTAI